MDNADYLDVALRLANADLRDLPGLQSALHDEPWWSSRATSADVTALREVAGTIRTTLDAAVRGDGEAVLASVNGLLAEHPPRPRVSGHGSGGWHIHVADPDASPATEVAAASAWGLAQAIVRHPLSRWGHCAAEGCGNYYLDSSTNQAKRFCSPRCANRVHVAAFRSRHRG